MAREARERERIETLERNHREWKERGGIVSESRDVSTVHQRRPSSTQSMQDQPHPSRVGWQQSAEPPLDLIREPAPGASSSEDDPGETALPESEVASPARLANLGSRWEVKEGTKMLSSGERTQGASYNQLGQMGLQKRPKQVCLPITHWFSQNDQNMRAS